MRNCTRDEGGPFGFGNQVLISSHRKLLRSKAVVVSGSCTERDNLAGDAKGKGASGSSREAESTDAPERGGLLRSVRWAAHESFKSPPALE